MDEKRAVELLTALRKEWAGKKNDPFFEARGEWVNGIVKGIDLSIWAITTERDRPGTRP